MSRTASLHRFRRSTSQLRAMALAMAMAGPGAPLPTEAPLAVCCHSPTGSSSSVQCCLNLKVLQGRM